MIVATQIFSALGDHRERMIDLAIATRRRGEVAGVVSQIEIRSYNPGGLRMESYVDAELHDGRSVCWWLEVLAEDTSWTISARVLENNSSGQDVVQELGECVITSPTEMIRELRRLTKELVDAAEAY